MLMSVLGNEVVWSVSIKFFVPTLRRCIKVLAASNVIDYVSISGSQQIAASLWIYSVTGYWKGASLIDAITFTFCSALGTKSLHFLRMPPCPSSRIGTSLSCSGALLAMSHDQLYVLENIEETLRSRRTWTAPVMNQILGLSSVLPSPKFLSVSLVSHFFL